MTSKIPSFQDGQICTPEGRNCIEEQSSQKFSCSVNCEGVYFNVIKVREDLIEADNVEEWDIPLGEGGDTQSMHRVWEQIQKIKASMHSKEEQANRKKVSKLVKEYNSHKNAMLKNFKFSSSSPSTHFGKIPYICKSEWHVF